MRRVLITVLLLSVVVLAPHVSVAQVYQLPTPVPEVNAASASWQVTGEPVFYAGNYYYPGGATVFFDGNVMRRSGVYRAVPLYEDSTVEPYSIVYVPVGRTLMRPYERRRDGELAGTAGSRTPSFPIQRDIELSVGDREMDAGASMVAEGLPSAQGSGDDMRCCVPVDNSRSTSSAVPPVAAGPTGVQSVPGPLSSDGVWIVFEDTRWYLDGQAVGYDANRFLPIGNYRGFPVYRESSTDGARIFLTVVPNGPVAPFARR